MVVYDPFIGMGTTALACMRLGVNYIGTEIDSEYIKVAFEDIQRRKKEMAIDTWLYEKNNDVMIGNKTSKVA
jgi:DNA modification methylase